MADYELTHDIERGAIVCRINAGIPVGDAAILMTALFAARDAMRARHGQVRLLINNRAGTPAFSSATMKLLGDRLRRERRPGDRTAVVVSNSLMKLHAKNAISDDSEVFISESAAMTWLQAWRHMAA